MTHAARHGRSDIITLLADAGASPDGCPGDESLAPLGVAIIGRRQAVFEKLLELGASRENLNRPSPELSAVAGNWPPSWKPPLITLYRASTLDNDDFKPLKNVLFVIGHNTYTGKSLENYSLLQQALTKSRPEDFSLFISYGARLNTPLSEGGHILLVLASMDDENLWGLMASYIKAGGRQSILFALRTSELKAELEAIIEAIINSSKKPESVVNEIFDNFPYLRTDATRQLQKLLDKIAEQTSDYLVCQADDKDCYGESVFNINQRDRAGNTPLFYAVLRGHRAAISTLIELGADVNQPGENGDTPLHLAYRNRDTWATSILIAANAKTDI